METTPQLKIGDHVRIEMYNTTPGIGRITSNPITDNPNAKAKGIYYLVKGVHDGEDYSGWIHVSRLKKMS